MWTQIGKYPYWPSLIMQNEQNEVIDKNPYTRIHVGYFADNGRHNWIPLNRIKIYNGRSDFNEWQLSAKKLPKKKSVGLHITDKQKPYWDKAIEEADIFLRLLREERVNCYKKMIEDIIVLKKVSLAEKRRSRKFQRSLRSQSEKLNVSSISPEPVTEQSIMEKVESPKIKQKLFEPKFERFLLSNYPKNIIFKGLKKSDICIICYESGDLIECNGTCNFRFHPQCVNYEIKINSNQTDEQLAHNFICGSCKIQLCFICNTPREDCDTVLCSHKNCGLYYHKLCLKLWPQHQTSLIKRDYLNCPLHSCHSCYAKAGVQQSKELATFKCIKCPAAYHYDSACIPAGTEFLNSQYIICPRHAKLRVTKTGNGFKNVYVNTNWCFICSEGGTLVCCESCPLAVHAECNKMKSTEDTFICDECESGRLPSYGDIVWAKYARYRWWPVIIVPPHLIPETVSKARREANSFCIQFFGSLEYGWITRQYVFFYETGDWGYIGQKNTSFERALQQAKETFELFQKLKPVESTIFVAAKPKPYQKIKNNQPVHPVRLQTNKENIVCDCRPELSSLCGPDSNCLNRLLMTECNPKHCPSGTMCQNQKILKHEYPPLKIINTDNKGHGLISDVLIKAGDFVIEYVGELIDNAEFQRRLVDKKLIQDYNFYFLTLEEDILIDAGPKGNLARFINHSCDPNCETQKWIVNGNTRIGIFAVKDIPAVMFYELNQK